MLRRHAFLLDSFKEHYHRVHLPRRVALQRYVRNEERKRQKTSNVSSSEGSADVGGAQTYKYNRWWVSNKHEFVHQYAVVEDPEVAREKRKALPSVTAENVWRDPHKATFLPFAPFARVVDYGKDPDAQFLKPTTVPRWKDYMMRSKPTVPRTWY